MPAFLLNRSEYIVNANDGQVLLDFLRTEQKLTGTKQACREGDCGACLVLSGQYINGVMYYHAVNSCLLPLGLIHGRHIVSIEGLNGEILSPVQQALVDQGAIQCGFCTAGIVIAITDFLMNAPESSVELAVDALAGNLCRCTGYSGIKRALHKLCQQFDLSHSQPQARVNDLIRWGILPDYFADIATRLTALPASTSLAEKQGINVAGGTDLFVQKAEDLLSTPLAFIDQPESISISQQQCTLSAATHIETIRQSDKLQALFPQIVDDFKSICSSAIRQQATLGGNLVNASPIGDLSVFFLALDAQLSIRSSTNQRRVALRHFFLDYKQVDLQEGELIHAIDFQYAETPIRLSFEKVSKRQHLDIASVTTAMSVSVQDDKFKQIHISLGGVAAIPLYLQKTCAFLQDKKIAIDLLKQALAVAQTEISPLSDIRGSAEYKRLLAQQLLIAHWLKLLPEHVSWEDFQ